VFVDIFGAVTFDTLLLGVSNDDFKCGYTRKKRGNFN
jgi:hypothetical protein